MTKVISVTEMLRQFSDYINRVIYRGESFVLTRGKLKVAEIRPAPLGCTVKDLKGYLANLPALSDEEIDDFTSDIERIKRESRGDKLKDPWA